MKRLNVLHVIAALGGLLLIVGCSNTSTEPAADVGEIVAHWSGDSDGTDSVGGHTLTA